MEEELSNIRELKVETGGMRTNLVFFRLTEGYAHENFISELSRYGVKTLHVGGGRIRMAFYRDIRRDDVTTAVRTIKKVLKKLGAK